MGTNVKKRSSRSAPLVALGEVFTNRDLRQLQLAWAAFILADSAYGVALAVFAFDAGGPGGVAVAMVCRLLPAALATPVVTVHSERYRGERVLAMTVALRAAAIAAIGAMALSALPVGVLYALVIADTIAMTAFRPTNAALSVLASRTPHELSAGNSVSSMIESLSALVGPLIAAGLLATTSVASVFIASAGLLVASALAALPIQVTGEPVERAPGEREHRAGLADELASGVRVLRSVRHSGLVLGLFSAQALVKGMWMVFVVIVAFELLRTGDAGVAGLQAALGAGGLVGALGTLALVGRRRLAAPFAAGLALWGPPIALIALLPHPLLALGLAGVLGAGKGLLYVSGLSLLQRMMDKELLGRVFGLLQSLALVATGVGAFVAAPLIEVLDLRTAMIAAALLMPVLIAVSWPRLAQIDRAATGNERALAALGGLQLFRSLPPLALEQLVAAAIPLTAPAGTEVVRQGERGERFYVVVVGLLDVFVDAQFVATLGPGGSFGEIALLRDLPRTATVRARTDVELYALERDDFLFTLTGRPASATAAASLADVRLRTPPVSDRMSETGPARLDRAGLEMLRSVPALSAIPAEALEELGRRLTGVRAHPGAEIIREGDYGDRLYLVLEGTVQIAVDGHAAATLEPGDSFGEGELVDGAPRAATARALTPVTLAALDRADFLEATGTPGAGSPPAGHVDRSGDRPGRLPPP